MGRELVERAMAADHDAFAELTRQLAGRLFGVARLILRDSALAEDATQEALVAAWRNIRHLRDPARFEAWIHRLVVNACYQEARRQRRRVELESMAVMAPAPSRDPAGDHATRDLLERGFRDLDIEFRTALVLHHYLGYSFAEMATLLGIPAGTAKSRVHRATKAVRLALDTGEARPALLEGRSV